MSDVATAVTTHQDEEKPPPGGGYRLLRRVQRFGYLILGIQLAGFLAWSAILFGNFSVTTDFATYDQPWYLIAHGNLDPFDTILHYPFWQNDGEFMPWVLAPFYWVTRSSVMLPWLQDASIVGAEAVALTWLCDVARRRCGDRDAAWLAGVGLLLLVANPWTWWAVSFDVHEEVLVVGFAALLAWDVSRGRRRAWFWVAPVLAGGAPSATYVVGIGLCGVLAGRRTRRTGAAMALMGAGYSLLLVAVHADLGVPLARHYGYLATSAGYSPPGIGLGGLVKGIIAHPSTLVSALWDKRADIFANLAPAGLLGLGAPVLLPLMLVVLLANTLSPGYQFAEPLFQSIPIYVLLPAGTIAVLCWLLPRHRRATFVLAGVIAAQAVGWAAVWVPPMAGEWLRIPSSTAATLSDVAARIPASAEVIASQGEVGRFAGRREVHPLFSPGKLPVHGQAWIIVTPTTGIQTLTVATSMALIGELAGPLHATLVVHDNDVWAFRWTPPSGSGQLTVPDGSSPLPAWAAAGAAGRPVLAGQEDGWHMAATGAKGYVADGVSWQEPAGRYLAEVTLAAGGPVNVEVWDDSTDTLLARRSIPGTDGREQVVLPAGVPPAPGAARYPGWGPFRADFTLPPPGQRIEIRVWSPGGSAVNVYSAFLAPAAPGRGATG